MQTENTLLLSFDRLGASYLGPYGNTWLETPGFNRLAAQSQLFEHAIAESLSPCDFGSSLYRGRHAAASDSHQSHSGLTLAEHLHKRGVEIVLVCDDADLTEAWNPLVDEVIEIEHSEPKQAASWEQTTLFSSLATVVAVLENTTRPTLLWWHSSALNQQWDAPFEWRAQLHDEDDPDPWDGVLPPATDLQDESDPDELFRLTMAYAAQVRVLDECITVLLESVKESPAWRAANWILTSQRGFPLGEHRFVGGEQERLFGESLRIPLLISRPGITTGTRHQNLVQPYMLHQEMLCWPENRNSAEAHNEACLGAMAAPSPLDRTRLDLAISIAGNRSALRTPAWFFTRHGNDRRLFAKPDDLWEVNDVLRLCVQVGEELEDLLDSTMTELQEHGNWDNLSIPDEHLMRAFP